MSTMYKITKDTDGKFLCTKRGGPANCFGVGATAEEAMAAADAIVEDFKEFVRHCRKKCDPKTCERRLKLSKNGVGGQASSSRNT